MVKMISGRGVATVRRLQGDLFAAGLELASPSIAIVLRRYNRLTTNYDELDPQTVLVRWMHDKGQARGVGLGGLDTPLMSSPTPLSGTFTALDPFDVLTGDRFTMDGVDGHVQTVWPVRNGRRRCSFIVDADTRTGP